MRPRLRSTPAIVTALALLIAAHIAATFGIVFIGRRTVGGVAIVIVLLVIVGLHAAGFRRLATVRTRRTRRIP